MIDKKIKKIDKMKDEIGSLKKLRSKHFTREDRVLLTKSLKFSRGRILRIINFDLNETSSGIKKLEAIQKKIEWVNGILVRDLRELDERHMVLKKVLKEIEDESKRLKKIKKKVETKSGMIKRELKVKSKRKTVLKSKKKGI